ncbi:HNH endonuclease [Streptomyces sp. NPDC090025]|uniref:HNH endonuclease n=1 Tax=Streptomyces sp. NPDC090025 TaxID=3365922 RepID=UPI0038346E37
MPYALLDDRHTTDPVWSQLAEGKASRIVVVRDAYVCLMTAAASHMTDGYLTAAMVTAALAEHSAADRRSLPITLSESVLGLPPKLHRPDDECACIPRGWDDGWDFYIHEFLKRNPSRKEKHLRDAKRSDLADSDLKALVLHRDGPYCRYCWSGPLSNKLGAAKFSEAAQLRVTYDHVDPEAPAQPDGSNLVVSCQRCNQAKGRCTPDVAGMPVLPAVRAEDVAALPVNFRGKYTVLGLPSEALDHPFNQRRIDDESADQSPGPINDSISDPAGSSGDRRDPQMDPADDFRDEYRAAHPRIGLLSLSGSGRVGQPVVRSAPALPEPCGPGLPFTPSVPVSYSCKPPTPSEGARP